jgi:hypothetical protein
MNNMKMMRTEERRGQKELMSVETMLKESVVGACRGVNLIIRVAAA